MQFNTKLRFFLENWTKNLENISLYPSFNWRYQLFRLNEIFKKNLNFEQVMNPPLKKVKNKNKNKKNPFPISFSNFSGKYILKTAFIIRFMYWYIQKRKQKKKDFLYLWPAMRGLFLLIHCGYMDRRLMCCMKCRNPSEYVYTWRYSEKKYHTTSSLVRIP